MTSSCMLEEECRERYGSCTCIFIESKDNQFEIKFLDESQQQNNKGVYCIDRKSLVEMIPKMLMKKYTVVLVEQIRCSKEITAIHLPVQSQLNTPPILQ